MDLGGSRQVGLGKKLLEQYAWQDFRPHPEWASFQSLKWLSLDNGRWIWSADAQPAPDAANIRRYFRRTFTIPSGREIARARLRFVGSSHVEAQLNGRAVGVGWDHLKGSQFDDRAGWLRPGKNALSIWVEHRPPAGQPIGLIACLEITFTHGEALRIETSDAWKCSEAEVPGWQGVDFDDRAWKQATVIGKPGDQPWGTISEPDEDFFGPQSAGIPGVVRIIYVPVASPVVVKHLGADTAYQAAYFDPVGGATARDRSGQGRLRRRVDLPAAAGNRPRLGDRARTQESMTPKNAGLILANRQLAWHFSWKGGTLRTARFDNRLSGLRFDLCGVQELALVFSAAIDRVAEPLLRVADFTVKSARQTRGDRAVFELRSRARCRSTSSCTSSSTAPPAGNGSR